MSNQANAGSTFEPVKLGEVRPSQLIHTYGAGSVLELPNFSVIVPGLDGSIHQGDPWHTCLLYTSPSPRDRTRSRMPSSA